MTSDEFVSKYKLLKQITSEGGCSHTAVERASGRHVLAHYLDEASGLAGESLADFLARLSVSDRSRILEVATVDGSLVVVTEVLEDFRSFSTWLRSHGSALPSPMPAAEPPFSGAAGGERGATPGSARDVSGSRHRSDPRLLEQPGRGSRPVPHVDGPAPDAARRGSVAP